VAAQCGDLRCPTSRVNMAVVLINGYALEAPSPSRRPTSRSLNDGGSDASRRVFLFFSNRLGCLGSILVSLIGTLIVLALLHVI
jgi:hypothetical protein